MADQGDQQKKDQQTARQHRLNLAGQNYESVLDQLISKAVEQGQFDNLAGQGKPQQLDDDETVPAELRLAFRALKSSGFAPPWIEFRSEIEADRAVLEAWLAQANRSWPGLDKQARAHLQAEYHKRLSELRSKILTFNLTAPASAHLEGIRLEQELARLGR